MLEFSIHVATMVALYGLLALSLNLQVGYSGLVNFGQIALFGCGTYGLGIAIANGSGAVLGFAFGIVLAVLLALLFARLGRRLGADYWGIATLSVAEIVRTFAVNEVWLTGGAQGLSNIPMLFGGFAPPSDKWALLAFCWAILGATWLLFAHLTSGRFGRALKLMRDEPNLAASLGYSVDGLRRQALIVAAIPAATAGFLFASYFTFVGPDQLVASETFLIWAMVIIGGLGNHRGALVGAGAVIILFACVPFLKDWLGLSSEALGAVRLMMLGGGLLAFLLWRPEGILPERAGSTSGG